MVQWTPLMIYTAIKIALYKAFCGWLKPKPSALLLSPPRLPAGLTSSVLLLRSRVVRG